MHVVSYSEARNNLKRLCDQIRRSRIPARIKRRGGDVVMIAAEDWETIQETLHIQSIPGAVERNVRRGFGDRKGEAVGEFFGAFAHRGFSLSIKDSIPGTIRSSCLVRLICSRGEHFHKGRALSF